MSVHHDQRLRVLIQHVSGLDAYEAGTGCERGRRNGCCVSRADRATLRIHGHDEGAEQGQVGEVDGQWQLFETRVHCVVDTADIQSWSNLDRHAALRCCSLASEKPARTN